MVMTKSYHLTMTWVESQIIKKYKKNIRITWTKSREKCLSTIPTKNIGKDPQEYRPKFEEATDLKDKIKSVYDSLFAAGANGKSAR